MKVSRASGPALDWMVAKCEGALHPLGNVMVSADDGVLLIAVGGDMFYDDIRVHYTPSTDWAQGGPIVEREGISIRVQQEDASPWVASIYNHVEGDWPLHTLGPTPLIAAMRCYVASKLGDEMEVPDELI